MMELLDIVSDGGTDVGRRREANEDSYDVFTVERQGEPAATMHVAVIADGVGGSAGGAEASRIAVDVVKNTLMAEQTSQPVSTQLEQAIQRANDVIRERVAQNRQLRGMSTTIVIAAISEGRLYVAHAGDSRAYLYRPGENKLYQLTIDHTWAWDAIVAERLSPEAARDHPNRNVVKRYLGTDSDVDIDHDIVVPGTYSSLSPKSIQTRQALTLQQGDTILLCSDGLTDMVSDEEIREILHDNYGNLQKSVDTLIDRANKNGGEDNITVVLLAAPDKEYMGMGLPFGLSRTMATAIVGGMLLLVALGGGIAAFGNNESDSGPSTQAPVAASTEIVSPTPQTTQIAQAQKTPTVEQTVAAEAGKGSSPAAPTSTPVTIQTASPTASSTRTRTNTSEAGSASPSPTEAPPPSPTPERTVEVELEEPADGNTTSDDLIKFWVSLKGMKSGYAVRLWMDTSPSLTSEDWQQTNNPFKYSSDENSYWADFTNAFEGRNKTYYWTIVVTDSDDNVVGRASETRSITWNPATEDNDDNDNNGDKDKDVPDDRG